MRASNTLLLADYSGACPKPSMKTRRQQVFRAITFGYRWGFNQGNTEVVGSRGVGAFRNGGQGSYWLEYVLCVMYSVSLPQFGGASGAARLHSCVSASTLGTGALLGAQRALPRNRCRFQRGSLVTRGIGSSAAAMPPWQTHLQARGQRQPPSCSPVRVSHLALSVLGRSQRQQARSAEGYHQRTTDLAVEDTISRYCTAHPNRGLPGRQARRQRLRTPHTAPEQGSCFRRAPGNAQAVDKCARVTLNHSHLTRSHVWLVRLKSKPRQGKSR